MVIPMMTAFDNLIHKGQRVEMFQPGPRMTVNEETWTSIAEELAQGRWTLLGLWGESRAVHMAIWDESSGVALLTCECPRGTFPSISRHHPPAMRLERTIHELYGLIPVNLPDGRPWLDHGRWGVTHPLGSHSVSPAAAVPYEFLPVIGENLHQIPVGPVHAGIIEPGHFRFTASGETVVRLEKRLGFVHKGVDGLLTGAPLDRACRIAARVSGDTTVAYSYAFARAVEMALNVQVPQRAVWLRALMAEIERLANHFGDIGAVCNDAAFALMHAQCGMLRELTLRAADTAFGHRLMMDRIVPGGVTTNLSAGGSAILHALMDDISSRLPDLIDLYDNTPSLQNRTVSTGVLQPSLAKQFGAGGHVGRASGRAFDTRWSITYPPYDVLSFDIPVYQAGDVDARVRVRIREVEQSIALIEQILQRLPKGAIQAGIEAPEHTGEGFALVEGFRGDILAWVRIDASGTVSRCHLRDPSWFQWPLLEAVIEGNIVADFPLCNKSFNCSYSGHDL
jgi:Ni,Fe-hydrogenase III large subunit